MKKGLRIKNKPYDDASNINETAKVNLVARCECGYVFDHLICTENIRECRKEDIILAVNKTFEFQPNICPCCHRKINSINYKTAINSNNPEIDFGYEGY